MTQPVNLDRWLPYRLFRVATRTGEILADYYVPRFGLTQAGWRTLAVVSGKPGMSARQIVRATGLDQFTISRAIAQLVEMDLIVRETAPHDKRHIAVSLTSKGQAVLEDINALAARIEKEMLSSLNDREQAQLDRIVDRLDDVTAGLIARGWRSLLDGQTETASRRGRQEEPI